LGERIVSWAGTTIDTTKFASVRFGNVIETKGNVFEVWKKEKQDNLPLSITDPSMKRYFFHIDEAVNFILKCLTLIDAGEIFIPKMKIFTIGELANEISDKQKVIGIRQGEKFEEILMTREEEEGAEELKDMWIIRISGKKIKSRFKKF